MLAVDGHGLVGVRRRLEGLVPPHVAAVVPGDVLPGAPDDEDLLDRAVLGGDGRVDGRLERGGRAAAVAAVGGDDDPGLGVGDPRVQRLGREATEDHGVRGADPRAGQHGHDRLGDHRHVDGDAVALAHAERLEGVGRLLHLAVQVGVGDGPGVARLALEVDGDAVAVAGLDVAVHAVVGGVELAAHVPLRERRAAPVKGGLEVLAPGHVLPGLFGPEALVVGLGGGIHLGRAVRGRRELVGGGEGVVLLQHVRQGLLGHGFPPGCGGSGNVVVAAVTPPANRLSPQASRGTAWGLARRAGGRDERRPRPRPAVTH